MTDKLNVSLAPHLRDALTTLLRNLPEEISQQLTPRLSPETNVIPYDLILKVSRWCQTPDGKVALQACSPPLDPQSYTMVSLLAGALTSPEKRFAPYAVKDPEDEQRLRTKDRKAIATLVNAIISVVGTGVATWWASERTGMQLEWRALSAVSAALVVAFAEIVLYMIWESQQIPRSRQPVRKSALVRHKDTTPGCSSDVAAQASSTAVQDNSLRHRTTTSTTESAVS